MRPYNIILTAKAANDIVNIKYYVKYMLMSPQSAETIEADLLKKFARIAEAPHIYPTEYFGKHIYRKSIVKKYIIAFRIDEATRTVHIIAIGHSLQKRKNIVK